MSVPANYIEVSVFARTDTGMQRACNEDAFMIADLTTGNIGLGPNVSTHRIGERGSLMIVSDGLGGAAAGEVASEMAVKTVRDALIGMPQDQSIPSRLERAVEIANQNIWNQARQDEKLKGMGATLTAVLAEGTSAHIAQVGDSRAYLIRGEQIKQLTKDQSWVQLLMEAGAIQPDQAFRVPQNVIVQALGTTPEVKVAITAVELCRNDSLLVCSDGLFNKVAPDEMRQTLIEAADLSTACRRLVEIANERGGEDNITVIVARFDGEALDSSADSGSITGSFTVLSEYHMSESMLEMSSQFAAPPAPEAQEPPTTLVFAAPVEARLPPAAAVQPGHGNVAKSPNEAPMPPPPSQIPLILVTILLLILFATASFFVWRYVSLKSSSRTTPPHPSQVH